MNTDFKIIIKGLMFIALFFLAFGIIYFTTSPVKINSFFMYSTIVVYTTSIVLFIIEIFRKFKDGKKFKIVFLILLLFTLIRASLGVVPYRLIVYTGHVKNLVTNFENLGTWGIRFFGMTTLLKISSIIFREISLKTFFYFSTFISFLGIVATYLISKKIYKKTTISLIPVFLILTNWTINLYLGCEEFSAFSIAFLMIAYYFLLAKKPIAAIFSFMSAAFSRTEIFLLFPFFIAQYWYINNVDFKVKEILNKMRKIKLSKKIIFSFIIIFLVILVWFFITNLTAFYSDTDSLEVSISGPSPNKDKAIFNYLYYHFTYRVGERIINSLTSMIKYFEFSFFPNPNTRQLSSSLVFYFFILSFLLGRKNKKVQIFGFNILFFFILYTIFRYEGFTYDIYRYKIYPIYLMSLIFPYFISRIRQQNVLNSIQILIIVFLLLLTITFVKETSSIKNFSSKVYLPFNESEIKNLKLNLNEKCSFLFITDYNPLVLESVSIHKSKFLLLETSYEKLKLKENIEEMKNKNECIYTIIPSTAKHDGEISPPFYEQAIGEKWCSNYQDCEDKIKKTINNLKELNFTLMLPFNKSKDDLGGIYYWEKPENQI